jgi:hypothetical protein
MYGEGYDYAELYVVQPGQTVGALPVGMESHFEEDVPYWPQVNTATYKEVWVCPPTKWMWGMADIHLPAVVSGYLQAKGCCEKGCDSVKFTHIATKKETKVKLHPRTGYFSATLPAGHYTMFCGGITRNVTFICGKAYTFDGALYAVEAKAECSGQTVSVSIDVKSRKALALVIKAENLAGYAEEKKITVQPDENNCGKAVIEAPVEAPDKPWLVLIAPEDNPADTLEVLDGRLALN